MKGVILAGGLGTRLHPLTKVTNKCLLPVYNKPMIYYPIQSMVDSGIKDILLVCGGNAAGEFLRILGNGEEFGLKHLHYTYQKEASGIADALGLAEEWAAGEPIAVMLADNILENSFSQHVEEFEDNPNGARIFLYEVDSPQSYGVAEVDDKGIVKSIEEKPKEPKSNLAVVGVYMYDSTVWEFIKRLQPSARGELEITDVNNYYLQSGKLHAHKLEGWWADCGESIDGYLEANNRAASL
ncbi:MAG: sugar phosphate nucleotidyltransferase [Candidatus Thorarchaeota archaeon]|jgi:glucose-1-phosphate thymidylyltransferase